MINVQLTAEQVDLIRSFLHGSLSGDTYAGAAPDDSSSELVALWRAHRSTFVASALASPACSRTRDEAEEDARLHDVEADLLETLSALVETQGSDRVCVPLSTDDVEQLCHDMASELYHDMTLARAKDLSEDDVEGVLKAWRAHAPHYVTDRLKYFERAKAHGYVGGCESRKDLEETRAMHDATADRLERLLPFLRTTEVSHG